MGFANTRGLNFLISSADNGCIPVKPFNNVKPPAKLAVLSHSLLIEFHTLLVFTKLRF
jgi:hypothetical protein